MKLITEKHEWWNKEATKLSPEHYNLLVNYCEEFGSFVISDENIAMLPNICKQIDLRSCHEMASFESRIQILDRLSKKWGSKDSVQNFDEFCKIYNSDAILQLTYIAMEEYAKQEIRRKDG